MTPKKIPRPQWPLKPPAPWIPAGLVIAKIALIALAKSEAAYA